MNMAIVEKFGRKKGAHNMLEAPSQPVAVHDRNMTPATPRAMHPAAAEAAAKWSDTMQELDELRARCAGLEQDLRVRDLHMDELRHQLDRASRDRDLYAGYTHAMVAHLGHIKGAIHAAETASASIATAKVEKVAAEVETAAQEVEQGLSQLVAERREPAAS